MLQSVPPYVDTPKSQNRVESPCKRWRITELNQIEIWFGILVRKLIKRSSFTSVEDLEDKVLAFIAYFNETMAKPFKWSYGKRPLTV